MKLQRNSMTKGTKEIEKRNEKKNDVASRTMGCHVVSFQVVDSTNDQGKQLGKEGCPHGTLVLADEQSKGRGRRGKVWESPQGTGIFMSLVLRPTFSPNIAPMLTLVMAYSIGRVLKQLSAQYPLLKSNSVQIKWPNDIIVNGKKVCGILTEMSLNKEQVDYVIIGVGINVNMEAFPREIEEMATSLAIEFGEKMVRETIVEMILEEFEQQYEAFCEEQSLGFLQDGYNHMLVNANKEVRVLDPRGEYEGIAKGIDDKGKLLVYNNLGEEIKIDAGEVSVRGIYGYV